MIPDIAFGVILFTELCPFVNCDHPSIDLNVESVTQKAFEILSQNLAQI